MMEQLFCCGVLQGWRGVLLEAQGRRRRMAMGQSSSHTRSQCSITAIPHLFPGSSKTGPGMQLRARGAHLGPAGLAETPLGALGSWKPSD